MSTKTKEEEIVRKRESDVMPESDICIKKRSMYDHSYICERVYI